MSKSSKIKALVVATTFAMSFALVPAAYAAATHLAMVRQPAGAVNGVAFTVQPVVQIEDGANARVNDSTTIVTARIASGTGTLSGATTVRASSGVATFSSLRITGTAGPYTLTFFPNPTLTPVTSSSFTLAVGVATSSSISRQPGVATNGSRLAVQPVVRITDSGGNTVTSSTVNVTASIAAGSGALSGATTVRASSGVATFNDLTLTGTAGPFTLRFAPSGLSSSISIPFSLGAGAATAVSIARQPGDAFNGVPIAVQPVVRIVDNSGNTVTTSNTNVVASLASGSGTLSGTTTQTAISGVATFTDLVVTGSPGQFKLTFAVAGFHAATSNSFTLKAGSATTSTIARQPGGAVDGVTFGVQPIVRIVDSNGNKVSGSTVNVVASIASGSGTLTGTTTKAAIGGVATFTDLAITGTTGPFMLRFTPAGVIEVTSNAFTLGIGVASKLALATSAAKAVSRAAFGTQPVVRIVDVGGNTVTTNASTVTALVSSGGVLTGTVNASAVGGVATFRGLGLSGISGTYTLAFNDGALIPTSQSIALTQPGVHISILVSRRAGVTTIKIINAKKYAGKRAIVMVQIKSAGTFKYRTLGIVLIKSSGIGILKTRVSISSSSTVIAKIGGHWIAKS